MSKISDFCCQISGRFFYVLHKSQPLPNMVFKVLEHNVYKIRNHRRYLIFTDYYGRIKRWRAIIMKKNERSCSYEWKLSFGLAGRL